MSQQPYDPSQHFSQPIHPQPSQPVPQLGWQSQPSGPILPTQQLYPLHYSPPPQSPNGSINLWMIVALGLLLLIPIAWLTGWLMGGSGVTPTPTTNQTVVQQTVLVTQVVQPTQPPYTGTWTTVQTFTGQNNKNTAVFSVPHDWKIVWSCTVGDFAGNFIVEVRTADNKFVDGAVNTICKTATSDETEEHQAGSFYLAVQADAPWTIQIQVLR